LQDFCPPYWFMKTVPLHCHKKLCNSFSSILIQILHWSILVQTHPPASTLPSLRFLSLYSSILSWECFRLPSADKHFPYKCLSASLQFMHSSQIEPWQTSHDSKLDRTCSPQMMQNKVLKLATLSESVFLTERLCSPNS
jgi:hypothetical protein